MNQDSLAINVSEKPGGFNMPLRRLYNWVIHWAQTPYALPALFLLSFTESSFFPIPPDVLLIAMCVATPSKSFRFATYCTIASVLGGIMGYGIGLYFWDIIGQPILNFYGAQAKYDYIARIYEKYNAWAVGIAGFTPIPYKVFTIGAGACKINFIIFVLASLVGRSARFFLLGALIYWKGGVVKSWIEKYFNWAVTLFTILLVGGFILVKWALKH